jgi:hypothetical protein
MMSYPRMFQTGLLLLGLAFCQAGGVGAGTITDDGRIRGRLDAPITLIEYSDFTCGYCLKFFKETLPQLQAKYIDTGKVKFVYRDYPRADRGVGRGTGAVLGHARSPFQRRRPFGIRFIQGVCEVNRTGFDGIREMFR